MNRYGIKYLLLSGLVLLVSCHKPYYIQTQKSESYVINPSQPTDSSINGFLKPYKVGVDTQMQVVIGHTDMMLTKAQPESSLGNFMADAQLEAAKRIDPGVQLSVMNYGGIRLPYIPPGAISRGKIYELMPFDNMLTITEIPGSVLKEFCDLMTKAKGWPISGFSFVIENKKAANILVNGEPLNEHLVYKMAISDYIAKGGDNCDFLRPLKKKVTSIFIRDILLDYLAALEAQNKVLHPEIQNRITYAE